VRLLQWPSSTAWPERSFEDIARHPLLASSILFHPASVATLGDDWTHVALSDLSQPLGIVAHETSLEQGTSQQFTARTPDTAYIVPNDERRATLGDLAPHVTVGLLLNSALSVENRKKLLIWVGLDDVVSAANHWTTLALDSRSGKGDIALPLRQQEFLWATRGLLETVAALKALDRENESEILKNPWAQLPGVSELDTPTPADYTAHAALHRVLSFVLRTPPSWSLNSNRSFATVDILPPGIWSPFPQVVEEWLSSSHYDEDLLLICGEMMARSLSQGISLDYWNLLEAPRHVTNAMLRLKNKHFREVIIQHLGRKSQQGISTQSRPRR